MGPTGAAIRGLRHPGRIAGGIVPDGAIFGDIRPVAGRTAVIDRAIRGRVLNLRPTRDAGR